MTKNRSKKVILAKKAGDETPLSLMKEIVVKKTSQSVLFIESQMDMLIGYPHYVQHDDAYKSGCSYLYFRLYEMRKRLIEKYFKAKKRTFATYPKWIIDKKYDAPNKRQFALYLSDNKDYLNQPMVAPDLLDACLKVAKDFSKASKPKAKKGLLFVFDGKNFLFKGNKFSLTNGKKYSDLFASVFAMAPNGGDVELSKLKINVAVSQKSVRTMNAERFLKFVKDNLVSGSSGFAKALKRTGATVESVFEIEKGGKTITFKNGL